MDWVKLSTRYYADPKVAALDDAAEVLFVRGLAYAGDQETGGFIPDALVPQLARRRRYDGCVDALVGSGLWTRAPGGYRMPAWSSWQDQLDVLADRRAADRERKRLKRAEQRKQREQHERPEPVRGPSADVRALEGETDRELPQGGMSTHDPPGTGPPPRRCQQHANDDHPPPCGACADARTAHDTWQTRHANTTNGQVNDAGRPPLPPEIDDLRGLWDGSAQPTAVPDHARDALRRPT